MTTPSGAPKSDIPPNLYGGTGNRAIAFIVDATLLAFITSFLSGIDPIGRYAAPLLAFLYLTALPRSPLQGSLGQWVCRIRLCDRQGRLMTWRASALRAGVTVLWFCLPVAFNALFTLGGMTIGKVLANIWWLFFLAPWASIGFRPRRESIFDLLAGSLVVTLRADTAQIAEDTAPKDLRLFSGVGMLLLCLAIGATIQMMLDMVTHRNLLGRATYAIQETRPLRAQIEGFYTQTGRWPTRAELGIAPSIPYPDGGHYSAQAEGKIVIRFSVNPHLKDRNLTFTPTFIPKEGRFDWKCVADEGLDKRYVPSVCRY